MHFSLQNKPESMQSYRKRSTIQLQWCDQPFTVDSQEGLLTISPDTVDDWDGGYFIAYPDDGSKPYVISRRFVSQNYEVVAAQS